MLIVLPNSIRHNQVIYETLDYYQSQTYMEDLDLSNKGCFDGIPCGVLSEDGVYNLLFDCPNLASQLRELADMLEQ